MVGIRDAALSERLQLDADLTLEKAKMAVRQKEAVHEHQLVVREGDSRGNPIRVDAVRAQRTTEYKGAKACYRCGGGHHPADCRFKDTACHFCGKLGHIAGVCRSKQKVEQGHKRTTTRQKQDTKWVQIEQEETPADSDSDSLPVLQIGRERQTGHPITVEVKVNDRPLVMELDTGAAVSVISEQEQRRLFPQTALKPTTVLLRTYTGEPMAVAGEMTAMVQYNAQSCTLPLIVVAGKGPTLLGRDWLRHLQLDWKAIGLSTLDGGWAQVQALIHKYPDVFAEELGKMKNHKATLHVEQNARPTFCKPRPVPFALKDAASRELNRLERAGILVKVSRADWAAPIVLVPKGDGCIRLCGDYKVTINPSLDIDRYPLPKPEDLFTSLTGGKKFTKLDLTQAYQQMPLAEESQQYSTINTHQGLYQFTRLPFGVASAPAIFQRTMDTILQGIPRVLCYIDDLLITGSTEKEHLQNLDEVLRRLQHNGITVKPSKCHFLKDSVEYLGHKIDADGLHTTTKKVAAIQQAPKPVNQQQLRSFLGLLQYYGKFIPNLSTMINPLNALLLKNQPWKWTNDCEQAFKEAKLALSSASVLVHYDPKLPLRLAADASAYGVGAVISHTYPDGEERPIAYASRTLTSSEKNYSQLEKEALSLIFGVKKFHQFLYGRRFTLFTDHKPLTTILGPKQGVPPIAAARLQRWALFLSAYNYRIEFKSTTAHANADCLSRLPLPTSSESPSASATVSKADVFVVRQIEALPVTAVELRAATRCDPILSKVLQYTKKGWPSKVPEVLKPYHNRRDQLTLEDDCVMWGVRVLVPQRLQQRVLEELHQSHLGIARSKALARSHVWWPKLDSAIETMTKSCI